MRRYKLTVAYEGTEFHGWQRQVTAEGRVLRTVQGVLEETVREVLACPAIDVVGASRTDAGVHALGQIAAFSAETRIPVEKLPAALTSRLPDDVQVLEAAIVGDDFDPIAGAVSKRYRYSIAHGGAPSSSDHPSQRFHLPPLFDRRFVWFTFHPLDPALMNDAAQHFLGEHDFTSFAQINHGRQSAVRTIFDCSVHATAIDRCEIEVTGNGFLYNMVRIVAGTLAEVGRGRIRPDEVRGILSARDRRLAGPTLPPHGLRLEWVRYAEDLADANG